MKNKTNNADWIECVYSKQKEYSMKLSTYELAYFIKLYEKYVPKKEMCNVDIITNSLLGGGFILSEKERKNIQQRAVYISKHHTNKQLENLKM